MKNKNYISKAVTRIAPSPTGDMHLGTLRTAYFCWLAARSTGGKFIVRIDDTDNARSDSDKVQPIYDALTWLGLDWDDTFKQSDNTDRYMEMADYLIRSGHAAFASDGTIRLTYIPKCDPPIHPALPKHAWYDTIAGDMFPNDTMFKNRHGTLFCLIKSDGTPSYNFATVVDDMDSGVNWIIRGKDHITNTFWQTVIWDLLGGSQPQYTHLGLLCKKNKPLSKRDNAASILWYKDNGYHPQAVLNYMLRMGWGPTVDDRSTKYIDKDRALKMFLSDGKMRSANSNIDQNKLDFLTKYYFRRDLVK